MRKDGKGLKCIMKREGGFLERIGTGKYRKKAGVGRNWNIEERRSKI